MITRPRHERSKSTGDRPWRWRYSCTDDSPPSITSLPQSTRFRQKQADWTSRSAPAMFLAGYYILASIVISSMSNTLLGKMPVMLFTEDFRRSLY
ncbi:hypothetical protein J6590_014409 [Homalodisca vitripennis]|nr:hypothetical protein J6590_014409 [Homalodisca vitripennis]